MAKGCVYIPKTGRDAGKVFGSKESLAAHMNYTPALTDMMAKFEQSGGKADIDSVTKWLSDNGYLKEKPAGKPSRRERLAKMFEEPKVEVAPEVTPEVTVEATPETTPKPSETVTRISEVAPAPRRVGAVEASEGSNENAGDESALEGVGMDEASLNEWKKANKAPSKKGRIEELAQAVRDLMSGKIKFKDYYEEAKRLMPSKLMDKVPTPATPEEIVGSVDRNKLAIGIMNLNKFVKKGMKVGLRIDIPAFNNFGKNVVTVHDRSGSGQPVIGYGSTGSIKNVNFRTSVSTAAKIAAGESKSAFAMAQGEWMDESPESIQKRAEEALNSPEWIQVGMNPTRNSFFFDKADGNPVVSADEVLQVGNLVLAKNAKKIDLNTEEGMAEFEKMFSAKTKEGVTYQFREGRRTRLAKMFENSDGKIAAEKVANFLREANIDVEILDPNSFEEKGKQRNFEGGADGIFLIDNNTGKIYLNKERIKGAEGKTIAFHEGIHPVVNIIRNTNPKLYRAIVDGLKAEAVKNKGVAEAADAVASSEYYQEQGPSAIDDETVVETMARVAAGDIDIDTFEPSFREKFIEFMNKLAKMLGLKTIAVNSPRMEVKRLADQLSKALNEGGKISDVVGKENISNYQNNIPIPGVIASGQMSGDINRTTDKPISVYQEKGIKKLPVKTQKEIYDKYDGKAVVINSDPTRVGELTLPSGKKIFMYGGPAYLSIEDNAKNNIGFATTQEGKVSSWKKYVDSLFGDKPGVTLVATQAPTSIMSNSYALRYVLDAISQLPKSVLKSAQFKNEFFGKDVALLKDSFGEKKYKEFIDKYKKADLTNPEVIDNMISEMSYTVGNNNASASFKARGSFVANLLGGLGEKASKKGLEGEKGYYSKEPQKYIAGQLMSRLGINAEKLIRDIGEPSIVDLYMNEGKWGFAVSGFETDPNVDIQSVQDLGVEHPLFNAKFPGKDAFLLDGAYEIDAMFKPIEMTGPKGAPYTKKASQMLAGSMYVKGGKKQGEQMFEYKPTAPSSAGIGRAQPSKGIKRGPKPTKAEIDTYLSEQEFFRSTSPFAWAVDAVSRETLENSSIVENEGTYAVVTEDGDIKGVFNPNVAKQREGVPARKNTLNGLIPKAIAAGGIKLDNFDGRLTELYSKNGFRKTSSVPFNEEYAPEGWVKEEHGTPDVVAMVYDPDNKLDIEFKKFDDYGDMISYRDSFVDQAREEYQGQPKQGQPSMLKRTSAEVQQLMEDSMDAVDQDVADGVDAKTAVEDNITSQEWYGQLTPKQKEQFDEIIKDEFGVTPKAPVKKVTGVGASIQNIVDNYYKLKDGDRSARTAINEILDADPKLKYIYDNISKINKQLQDAGVITDKTDGCP